MTAFVVGDTAFYFDRYIPCSKENAIYLYKTKSDLDYMPPIKIKNDMLSDFGKEILNIEGGDKE